MTRHYKGVLTGPAKVTRLRKALGTAVAGALLAVAACGGGDGQMSGGEPDDQQVSTVRVVTNFGTIYYGLLLGMEMLDEERTDITVENVQLSAGGDSMTALASDQADLVSVGVSPLLVARDKGLPVKFGGALVQVHTALVAMDDKYQSLEDFGPSDRIATPGPHSVGSIALLNAAERELGDFKLIEDLFRIMPHPDAVAALANGEVQGHMATPPFLQQNLANGAHEIIGGDDLLNAPVPLGAFALSEKFHDDNPELYLDIIDAIERGTEKINNDPEGAAELLAEISVVDQDSATILKELTEQGIEYTTEFGGYGAVAETMVDMGLLDSVPELEEVAFENVRGS